jgi:hypothetical protein
MNERSERMGDHLLPPPPPSPPQPGWWQASDGNWYPPEQSAGPTAYGPPPAYGGVGYGYAAGPTATSTNGLAVASLVLGILWLDGIGSVLAVIFGFVALNQIKQRNQRGRGMAIGGLVLGWIGIALVALAVVAVTSWGHD